MDHVTNVLTNACMPLCLCSLAAFFGQFYAAAQIPNALSLAPPGVMRLCIDSGCNNLTWTGDHYDGTNDGQTAIVARYWVKAWRPDYIELYGKTAAPVHGRCSAEGRFSGKIADDGVSVTNARDEWHIGHSAKGTMSFTLTWGARSAAAPRSELHPPPSLPIPSVILNSTETTTVCRSKKIREAMQVLEDLQAHDPGGRLLGRAACAITEVCGDTEHPENIKTTVLASRPATDRAGITANDPGSFTCQGLFLRGAVHLEASQDGDSGSLITKERTETLLQEFPNFEEDYKVKPLEKGEFKLILIPAISGLTRPYSTSFYYP